MKKVIFQSKTDKTINMIMQFKPYHLLLKGKSLRLMVLSLVLGMSTQTILAQAADAAAVPEKAPDVFYDAAFAYTLAGLAVLLAAVIYVLGNVFLLAIRNKVNDEKKNGTFIKTSMLVILLSSVASTLSAQTTAAATTATVVSENVMLIIGLVIILELVVIFYLAFGIRKFLKKESFVQEVSNTVVTEKAPKVHWFDRLYNRNTQEDIIKLDLGHDYDGIKELDNDIPVWWKYGFAFSVLFGVIYLYSYHIAGSRPLQQKELQIDQALAAERQAAYLEKSANNVDENTVKMLDADGIAAGKALFIKPGACATCHAENGSAIVNGAPGIGPNLTDDYWLHKGDIQSIFKSIKYGWPEKGMKSWKDDYSPVQIAQLASYVKSLKGTNPAPAKEKQGELFTEAGTAVTSDASATPAAAKDSAQTMVK